jgi:flagellar motor switch protein FliN/FliY
MADATDSGAAGSAGNAESAGAGGPQPGDPIDIPDAALNGGSGTADQASIDELLQQAAAAMQDSPAVDAAPADAGSASATQAAALVEGMRDMDLPDLHQLDHEAQASGIDLLRDVDLNVKIELGRTRMLVEDVLKLSEGAVVELDKLAGDPVDVFVNDRLVARGEVLVLNDNFCVRINEIVVAAKEDAA